MSTPAGRPPISARAVLALLALATACGDPTAPGGPAPSAADAGPATFVGRAACAACHAKETAAWQGSHHDLAMQEATDATVLGDFDGATFTYAGVTTTFFRRDGAFFARTDGPDGELRDYEIAYAFGAEPLQQYLVAFPGGRYQALSIVWDTRPAEQGGQRWYHLYPGEGVDHRDPLHWTGVHQNWNQQCAECHSTNLQKGYDAGENAYATTWSEIDVSCEACHGPGSAHAARAERVAAGTAPGEPSGEVEGDPARGLVVDLKDRSGGVWEIDRATGLAARSAPPGSRAEVDVCGRCHARRSLIARDYEHGLPLLDTHRPALLEEGLYHADGQVRDEVYVWGSFVQSRMYRAGVVCTDCHDPHALEIPVADAACARCHLAEKFAAPEHHFHPPASDGASCVACHMPVRTYLGVDARRDHGFRVPRPDLSLALGTPDACSDCHADRSVRWAAGAFAGWYGDVGARRPHFAAALDAGRRGLPGARRKLAAVAADPAMPGIARASALALVRGAPSPEDLEVLRRGLADPDPIVRLGAVRGTEGIDPPWWAEPLWVEMLEPLLVDGARAVRIEAGRVLSRVPRERIPDELRPALGLAVAEYLDAQEANADRPDGQLHLGLMLARQGRVAEAERAYRRALALDPWFSPAAVNLADLYRATGRDAEGEQVLRALLERQGDDPSARHALGLALVRRGRHAEALVELARAADLAPRQARYAYVYGVALHSRGETEKALEVLAEALDRHPVDPDLLSGLATIHRDAGQIEAAREYAAKLVASRPEDPGARRLAAEIGG